MINLLRGEKFKYADLIKSLDEMGYCRVSNVTSPGQFLNQGGLIIIFPVNCFNSFAVDFFGDEIESIKSLDEKEEWPPKVFSIESNIVTTEDNVIIKPDDYVVHIDHGIGIYRGKLMKRVAEKNIQYLNIEYSNNDNLYLPSDLQQKITRYIGVGRKPKLNKLGTATWEKTKKRAVHNALRLARELLQIYAKRELTNCCGYKIDTVWDKEIQQTFGYRETADQDKAINDVYRDLRSDKPMDRLISGDVGFGKTEVALRALIQAVANGKQAAIICPTTILCQQHYVNIIARTGNLPVKVAMLSRFVDSNKQQELIKEISQGKIDIIVGTHRLLSKDVHFNNLDLMVIDEEQRFGVSQKELFKKNRENINVLSLSATPIPRTLFMSLSGIRDISQITTPPQGRKSIETEVRKYDLEVVKKYLNREVERGGQAYYLYNRVETIEAVKTKLKAMLPEVKFIVAHGQMPEGLLENTMAKFSKKEYDVLICSTIIENGLDLPNVNTLIVDNAQNFGLSQLYQIRGRIGRSERQSYALLLHQESKLTGNVYKRLKSLAENTSLGSGFNVAMSDLEIRGGGNILGREQHGNMEAVGLILYSQMLKNAVARLSNIGNQPA